jgi:hypothetical protein
MTILEVYEEQITLTEVPVSEEIELLIGAKELLIEVHEPLPDTSVQIGGADPTDNPNILVWYDTQGA